MVVDEGYPIKTHKNKVIWVFGGRLGLRFYSWLIHYAAHKLALMQANNLVPRPITAPIFQLPLRGLEDSGGT